MSRRGTAYRRPVYVRYSRNIKKNCSWNTHINNVIEKGKVEVGRMGVLFKDSHVVDTSIKRCIQLNVVIPKPEYGEVWEENGTLVEKLKTVQMTAAKKIQGYSKTKSNTALRYELGMHSLKAGI